MQLRVVVGPLLCSVVACTAAEPSFVRWPEFDSDTLSFLVVQAPTAPSIHGPFGPDGPDEALVVPADAALYVVRFDETWIRERHARVDEARLMEMRLRTRPADCDRCESICRGPDDEVLYQPVGSAAKIFELIDQGFVPIEAAIQLDDLWLELPARWDCVVDEASSQYERVDTWPTSKDELLFNLGEDGLLATGPLLRRLGDDPSRFISLPQALFRGAVAWGDHHALVAVRHRGFGQPGRLVEIDLTAGAFEIVREQALPINPSGILRSTEGIVVVGLDGGVVTSTDAIHFRVGDAGTRFDLAWISRVPDQSPPYFIGSSRGRVLEGDPWSPSSSWSEHFASVEIDYPIFEVFEVAGARTAAQPDGRWLWARAAERGSFERPFDGDEWRLVQVEPPRTTPECTQGIDDCGFVRFPHVSSQPHVHDGHVHVAPTNCARILVAYPDRGCASSFAPAGDPPLRRELRSGLVGVDGGVVMLTGEGALFVPLP